MERKVRDLWEVVEVAPPSTSLAPLSPTHLNVVVGVLFFGRLPSTPPQGTGIPIAPEGHLEKEWFG